MRVRGKYSQQNRWPDYAALIAVLMTLRRIPDPALGETTLNRSEAKRIRGCGFEARAGGTWRCPLLPDQLVRGNPLLEPLAAGYDQFFRSLKWNPERARPLHPVLPSSFTKIEEAILRVLRRAPDCRLAKRTLQQRLWRLPAKFLNHMIQSLAERGYAIDQVP